MIRNIKRTWFEVWGAEEAQNRFLKALLVFFITLCCTECIALVILAVRKLPVVAVSATESRVLTIIPPKAEFLESEVKRAVTNYMTAHYNWEWTKIDDAFREASRFVHPDFTKKFLVANDAQIRVTKEKKVSQRFYISESKFDLKAKAVTVTGDRILLVEGLRATNPLIVQVEYDFGPRIETNPEGVYIVGEKLISAPEGGAR